VFAVAGIARPDRFFSDLAGAGWHVAGTLVFRDHYRFKQKDVDRIAAQARGLRASIILTTEKDAVRLSDFDLAGLPIAFVPLVTIIEPEEQFSRWLLDRIHSARTRNEEPGTGHS
jgi:tetraacyldisaccharide 4'-kinase